MRACVTCEIECCFFFFFFCCYCCCLAHCYLFFLVVRSLHVFFSEGQWALDGIYFVVVLILLSRLGITSSCVLCVDDDVAGIWDVDDHHRPPLPLCKRVSVDWSLKRVFKQHAKKQPSCTSSCSPLV